MGQETWICELSLLNNCNTVDTAFNPKRTGFCYKGVIWTLPNNRLRQTWKIYSRSCPKGSGEILKQVWYYCRKNNSQRLEQSGRENAKLKTSCRGLRKPEKFATFREDWICPKTKEKFQFVWKLVELLSASEDDMQSSNVYLLQVVLQSQTWKELQKECWVPN